MVCVLFASCGAFDGFEKVCAYTHWLSTEKVSSCVSCSSRSSRHQSHKSLWCQSEFCTLGNMFDTTHTARKLQFKLDHMLRLFSGCLDAVWQPESWWRQCADPWRVPLIAGSRVFHVVWGAPWCSSFVLEILCACQQLGCWAPNWSASTEGDHGAPSRVSIFVPARLSSRRPSIKLFLFANQPQSYPS